MKLIIEQGRVIDPNQQIDRVTNIYIARGHILSVGDQAPDGFVADKTISAHGKWIFPGLVDMQARVGDLATETKAAAAGGITGLCCPPDTNPVIDTQAMAELIQRRARQAATAFVMPIGALTQGLKGEHLSEMYALKQGGCIALGQANRTIQNPLILKNALDYAASHNFLAILRSENQQLKNDGVAHSGAVSTRLGLPSIPPSAETTALARDLILVEESGVRAHFSQISCARSVEMIRDAKKRGLPISCDVAIHNLHLTEMDLLDFNSLFHVTPPLRSHADREALRMGVKTGVIDVIVSDHTPLGYDDKELPFGESTPGISGLETLLALSLRLVDEGVLTLNQAIQILSENPANILGLRVGSLQRGYSADLVIFNPETHWTLNRETMRSNGKNSPFIGWEFSGQVETTLFQGRPVYQVAGA